MQISQVIPMIEIHKCVQVFLFFFLNFQLRQKPAIWVPAGSWPGDTRMGEGTTWYVCWREKKTYNTPQPWVWRTRSRYKLKYMMIKIMITAHSITRLDLARCLKLTSAYGRKSSVLTAANHTGDKEKGLFFLLHILYPRNWNWL